MVSHVLSLQELKPGRFLGRYELLAPIAQGGMAAVWAARLRGSRGFQKIFAIKTILPTLSDDPRFEQMFLDEAALASRIRHSNVVQVLDLGEEQGLLYQVMEWIEGQALSALVRESPGGNGLPHAIASKIMIGVCEGLHAAHEMRDDAGSPVGLVHRDVSPQNILVSIDGVPKVVDFGVAKASSLSTARTVAGTFKGKPAYMAPEQVMGREVDRRADIFALGVILYLITTGRHPYRGESDMATLQRVTDSNPPPAPSEWNPNYSAGLAAVVMRAIQKNAADRFATASDMARAIQQAVPQVQETGDTDVAACVRQLGERHLKARADSLRSALAALDESSPPGDRLSNAPAEYRASSPSFSSAAQLIPRASGLTPTRPDTASAHQSIRSNSIAGVQTIRSARVRTMGVGLTIVAAVTAGVVAFSSRQPGRHADARSAHDANPAALQSVASIDSAGASAGRDGVDLWLPEQTPSADVSADSLHRMPDDLDAIHERLRRMRGHDAGDLDKQADASSSANPSLSNQAPNPYVPRVRDPGF